MSKDDELMKLSARKREALSTRLAEGRIQVRVDSTKEGVILPPFLMDRVQVTLNLSYAFKPEVFVIDEEGVQVTLSFSGEKSLCVLPWDSLYFLHSLSPNGESVGDGEVFIESIPHDLLEHYGLTLRVMRDEEEDIPITRPIHAEYSDAPASDRSVSKDKDLSLEEELAELSELRDWVRGLEHIDKRRTYHKWPVPIEVIQEVVEELDDRGLLDPKPNTSEPSKSQGTKNHSRSREAKPKTQVRQERQASAEAEHTPERGIISLQRFQATKPSHEGEA